MYFRKSFPSSLALPILFIINITFAFGASVLQVTSKQINMFIHF